MLKPKSGAGVPKNTKKFSEAQEMGHNRNEVAQAQKQMASQETTGLLEQQ